MGEDNMARWVGDELAGFCICCEVWTLDFVTCESCGNEYCGGCCNEFVDGKCRDCIEEESTQGA